MDGARTLRRLLVALAALLLLLEAAAVLVVVRRADATERPRSAGVHTSPGATARRQVRLSEPAPRETEPAGYRLVHLERSMPLFSRPGDGRVVGEMPATSPHYGAPTVAWILEITDDGRFGRVPIPYAGRDATGWLRLHGLQQTTTRVSVIADLSRHRMWVLRDDRVVLSAPVATGAAVTPTPVGRYSVSDLVAIPDGGAFGTFALGLSGIQPNLPDGWKGGDQLAIHGTDDPASIGTSASAGCLRVSERVLDRLRRMLELGTPVIVQA